jgi:hypothetical protein
LFGNRSVAFIPSSRRPGFFGIAVFSRAGDAALEEPSAEVGWVASAVIAEVYDADSLDGSSGYGMVVVHDASTRSPQARLSTHTEQICPNPAVPAPIPH